MTVTNVIIKLHSKLIWDNTNSQCMEFCDYMGVKGPLFLGGGTPEKHQESIHEGVKYIFNQCDYKAT